MSPMATAGTPIRTLNAPLSRALPRNLPRPRATPRGIDQHEARIVASPETKRVLMVISIKLLSPANISLNASPRPWRMTDAIRSTPSY